MKLPKAGTYEVWSGTDSSLPPLEVSTIEGDSGTALIGTGEKLFVLDKETGNLAAKAPTGNALTLKASDFNLIGRTIVRVEHEGKPVAAASVSVKGRPAQVLDPQSSGQAVFVGLKPGPVTVEVVYRSGERMAAPIRQTMEISLQRSKPEPVLVISIPDEVATIEAAGSAAAPASKAETPPVRLTESRSTLGSIVTYLVVLALVAAIGWFGYQWMVKNQEKVKPHLQKLGVDIPEPQAQPVDDPVPPPIAIPEPPQKIILDDAAPAPISVAATPMVSGSPRLVGDSGMVLDIEEGIGLVGRDDAHLYGLPAENTVSRKHAQISRDGGTVVVKDLGSTNGTFVNGAKVDDEATLRPGDTVQFGAVRFRFEG